MSVHSQHIDLYAVLLCDSSNSIPQTQASTGTCLVLSINQHEHAHWRPRDPSPVTAAKSRLKTRARAHRAQDLSGLHRARRHRTWAVPRGTVFQTHPYPNRTPPVPHPYPTRTPIGFFSIEPGRAGFCIYLLKQSRLEPV